MTLCLDFEYVRMFTVFNIYQTLTFLDSYWRSCVNRTDEGYFIAIDGKLLAIRLPKISKAFADLLFAFVCSM